MENLFKKHSIQQQCGVYFCIKIFFKSGFVWLIWPFECLILMILTLTKYHENLFRDSPLSLLFMVKFLSSLETKMVLKIPNKTFLRITRYYALYTRYLHYTHSITAENHYWSCHSNQPYTGDYQ